MNHLNIFELYKSINDKKANKKNYFEQVLVKCHAKIKLAARMDFYACFFEVPEIVIGIPLYNITECITYIVDSLKSNGFVIRYLYPKTIYISWDPKIINKTNMENTANNINKLENYDNYLLTNKSNGKFTLNVDN